MAAAAWLMERRRRCLAARGAEAAQAAHGEILRLLRLAAGDQRKLGLTLLGHAQNTRHDAPGEAALKTLARRLLDLSDDLVRQTEVPDGVNGLVEEDIFLMPVVEHAVAQVASHLGPGRRVWRIDPVFVRSCLLADRRAINQVLVNVLSSAAAATADGDLIEITAEPGAAEWSIYVLDEGIGLSAPLGHAAPDDSRGIGLQLTLARRLMLAHGGTLSIESREHVGTRVRLGFPLARILECRPANRQIEPFRRQQHAS